MQQTTDWTLKNNHGLNILGNTEHPESEPVATLVLLHGFKGYKDYGFIPILAQHLATTGILVHRFNFSTSGMTNELDTFARPDLFKLDTWTRQVEDTHAIINAINNETLPGANLPLFLCGHSRGGATTLLAASRKPQPTLAGIITINAVDSCNNLDDQTQSQFLSAGSMTTVSARTDQQLKINAPWLQDQLDNPQAHDILNLCKSINTPSLIMHGSDDQAVNIHCGQHISKAINTDLHTIDGANHALNMSNPAPKDALCSPQLSEVLTQIQSFVNANRSQTPI